MAAELERTSIETGKEVSCNLVILHPAFIS